MKPVDVDNLDIKTTSIKGEKIRLYTMKFKWDAVNYAKDHSNRETAAKLTDNL